MANDFTEKALEKSFSKIPKGIKIFKTGFIIPILKNGKPVHPDDIGRYLSGEFYTRQLAAYEKAKTE